MAAREHLELDVIDIGARSPGSGPEVTSAAPNRLRREAEAKAVCHRCPVITACRQHALRVQEPYGIWDGLSAEERATLPRTRRRTARGTAADAPTYTNIEAPQ